MAESEYDRRLRELGTAVSESEYDRRLRELETASAKPKPSRPPLTLPDRVEVPTLETYKPEPAKGVEFKPTPGLKQDLYDAANPRNINNSYQELYKRAQEVYDCAVQKRLQEGSALSDSEKQEYNYYFNYQYDIFVILLLLIYLALKKLYKQLIQLCHYHQLF